MLWSEKIAFGELGSENLCFNISNILNLMHKRFSQRWRPWLLFCEKRFALWFPTSYTVHSKTWSEIIWRASRPFRSEIADLLNHEYDFKLTLYRWILTTPIKSTCSALWDYLLFTLLFYLCICTAVYNKVKRLWRLFFMLLANWDLRYTAMNS